MSHYVPCFITPRIVSIFILYFHLNLKNGATALIQACQNGHKDVVRALLHARANVHLRGSKVCKDLNWFLITT